MSQNFFSPLSLSDWEPTLKTLQTYAQVIGKVRRAMTPAHKHWYHVSLRVSAAGLTTTAIPVDSRSYELLLDLTTHKLVISTSRGEQWHTPLRGQSPAQFCNDTLAALANLDIYPEIDKSLFSDTALGTYDRTAVERYWQALAQIDAIFKQFKGELRRETSPVQLWPHHIDLALLWFSGRLVPGEDPADEESADEQMNFGFSPGDEGIPDPYFFITAYPTPDGLTDTPLPDDTEWHTASFTGALMMYESLVDAADPATKLLTFLRTVQKAGADLMR